MKSFTPAGILIATFCTSAATQPPGGECLANVAKYLVTLPIDQMPTYIKQVASAARFPVNCEDFLGDLAFTAHSSRPALWDEKGQLIASFEGVTLTVQNPGAFEARNVCQPGRNETSPHSQQLAAGLAARIDRKAGLPITPAEQDAEHVFDQKGGQDIISRAMASPACGDDIARGILGFQYLADDAKLQPAGKNRLTEEQRAARHAHLIAELAEKPLVKGGECGVGY